MSKVFELFGCGSAIAHNLHLANSFFAGMECEIESVKDSGDAGEEWAVKQDNSLRNNGLEYVSPPLPRQELMGRFSKLHKVIKLGTEPFSVRTSTHVHVNVASMEIKDARTMVLLYALFEECFFMMTKPERRDNIHCVPLTETHLPSIYKHDLVAFEAKWSKYTALNIKRLKDLGTVEFRHLHGTDNETEVAKWLEVLENLWKLAQEVNISAATLTSENILMWFETIFKNVPEVLQLRPTLFHVIRNNLIDVKFSV
jgi:hypothetical protein